PRPRLVLLRFFSWRLCHIVLHSNAKPSYRASGSTISVQKTFRGWQSGCTNPALPGPDRLAVARTPAIGRQASRITPHSARRTCSPPLRTKLRSRQPLLDARELFLDLAHFCSLPTRLLPLNWEYRCDKNAEVNWLLGCPYIGVSSSP